MISIEAKVDSIDFRALKQYTEGLPARTLAKLHRIVLTAAINVQGDAKESILQGEPTGRLYRRGRKGKLGRKGSRTQLHQASAPGQPPASDTGTLANSIAYFDYKRKKSIRVAVGSTVAHGLFTEVGTKRMKARPWLQPALEASRPSLEKQVRALAVNFGDI